MKVENSAEIVAKKLYHRGNQATARDLFDLALVIEREQDALISAAPYLTRYREQFVEQINQRRFVLEAQYRAIDRLNYDVTYDHAVNIATKFLNSL